MEPRIQYVHNPICKKNVNYLISYGFFFTFNLFGYFLIIYNIFNFNYGKNIQTVKFLFSFSWLILSILLSRCFCIIKDEPSSLDNGLLYE